MSVKGVFGMESPSDFWNSIRTAYEGYKSSTPKKVELILYVVMGLNHLADWIFNDSPDNKPTNAARKFCEVIRQNNNFIKLKEICDHSKHTIRTKPDTSAKYDVIGNRGVLANWETLAGPPIDFYVGTENITAIVDDVMNEYAKWFERTNE